MNRSAILDAANKCVTVDRAATHGDAEDSFSLIAGHWNWWLSDKLKDTITAYDVAQMMAGFKQARARGNPQCDDNFVDAVGYAAIAGEIATRKAEPAKARHIDDAGKPYEAPKPTTREHYAHMKDSQ